MSKQKEKKICLTFSALERRRCGKGQKDGSPQNQMKQISFRDRTLWQKMFPENKEVLEKEV